MGWDHSNSRKRGNNSTGARAFPRDRTGVIFYSIFREKVEDYKKQVERLCKRGGASLPMSEVRKASLFCAHMFRENVPAVTDEVTEQRTQ